jgi:hypothetical protein
MILKTGKVIVSDKEVLITEFDFGKFKKGELDVMSKLEALYWAQGVIARWIGIIEGGHRKGTE